MQDLTSKRSPGLWTERTILNMKILLQFCLILFCTLQSCCCAEYSKPVEENRLPRRLLIDYPLPSYPTIYPECPPCDPCSCPICPPDPPCPTCSCPECPIQLCECRPCPDPEPCLEDTYTPLLW